MNPTGAPGGTSSRRPGVLLVIDGGDPASLGKAHRQADPRPARPDAVADEVGANLGHLAVLLEESLAMRLLRSEP